MPTLWEANPSPKLRPEMDDSYPEKKAELKCYSFSSQIKDKHQDLSAGNQFGPMFKDRDHFNSMHFA